MRLCLKLSYLAIVISAFSVVTSASASSPFYMVQQPSADTTNVHIGFLYNFPTRDFYNSDRKLQTDPKKGKYNLYDIYISAERGLGKDFSVGIDVSVTHKMVTGAFYEGENDYKHTRPYGFSLYGKRLFVKGPHFAFGAKALVDIPFTFDRDPAPYRWGDGRFGAGGELFAGLKHPTFLLEAWAGGKWMDEKPKAESNFGVRGRYFVVNKYLYLDVTAKGKEPFVQNEKYENPFLDTVSEESRLDGLASLGTYIMPLDTLFEIYFSHSIIGRHTPLSRNIGVNLGFVF